MHTLALDPRSIILPTKTGLRIYSTQGTVELRSKNLARVHEILQGRLAGQYSEKALIAAVPFAQRMTVRRYLHALRDAGAIQSGKNSAARYVRQPAGKGPKRRLRTGMSETSGDDHFRGSKHASLQYITRQEFASLLVRKVTTGVSARHQIYVLTDESCTAESSSEVCDRQAFYSKWLLDGEFSHRDKPKIKVFQIDKNTGALARKATLVGKSLVLNRHVPKALELVRATDIEQAPLAVCQADFMLCSVNLRRFGVDYDRVADEVLRDLLMHMTIESADMVHQIRWQRMLVTGVAAEPPLPQIVRADDCLVGASPSELRLRLIERILGQTHRTTVHMEECDLLQSWNSSDMDYLAQVLRQRHSCLKAQVTTRVDGLYQCMYEDLQTASLLKHKALRDLMILLTWRTYYERSNDVASRPAHECDYSSIRNPVQLRMVLNRTIKRSKEEIVERDPVFAKISCWGKTAWIGTLNG